MHPTHGCQSHVTTRVRDRHRRLVSSPWTTSASAAMRLSIGQPHCVESSAAHDTLRSAGCSSSSRAGRPRPEKTLTVVRRPLAFLSANGREKRGFRAVNVWLPRASSCGAKVRFGAACTHALRHVMARIIRGHAYASSCSASRKQGIARVDVARALRLRTNRPPSRRLAVVAGS